MGPRACLGDVEKRKFLTLPDSNSEPWSSSPLPVAVPTELPRLPEMRSGKCKKLFVLNLAPLHNYLRGEYSLIYSANRTPVPWSSSRNRNIYDLHINRKSADE
jgi:hypothetical protein